MRIGVLLAAIGLFVTACAADGSLTPYSAQTSGATRAPVVATGGDYTYERLDNPPRTVVKDSQGTVAATLTDGARTAVLTGAARAFSEPGATSAEVDSTAWVRLAPQEWQAGEETADWFRPWLDGALQDKNPDVLAIAMEYLAGAASRTDGEGVRIAGDASFGPVAPTGAGRLERSDFYDYLGVDWSFGDGTRTEADPAHYGAVDCSGFVRLVYGYRSGYPLLATNTEGQGLPRRAFAIAEFGPGVTIVPNQRRRSSDYEALQPGDLVFFEVEGGEEQLDHAGIYLGVDSQGGHRFMSSRERINGPTLGDVGGTSLLDDDGMYSRGFRAARRI